MTITIGSRVLVTWPIRRVGSVLRSEPDGRLLVSSEGKTVPVWPVHMEPYEQPVLHVGDVLRGSTFSGAHGWFRVTGIGRRVTFVSYLRGVADVSGIRGSVSRGGCWIDDDEMWRFSCE